MNGSPGLLVSPEDFSQQWRERFWSQVDTSGDCWEWHGPRMPKGYGYLTARDGSGAEYAHRLAWEMANGPIPDGFHVLHRCDNPPCCNPVHLWAGTAGDNIRDCVQKGRHAKSVKTHCPRGHSYSPENTSIVRGKGRVCLTCQRAYSRCRRIGAVNRAECVQELVGALS